MEEKEHSDQLQGLRAKASQFLSTEIEKNPEAFEESSENLLKRLLNLKKIIEIGKEFNVSISIEETLRSLMKNVSDFLKIDNILILFKDEDLIKYRTSIGLDTNNIQNYSAIVGNQIDPFFLTHPYPISIDYIEREDELSFLFDVMKNFNLHIIVPMIRDKEILGFFLISKSYETSDFSRSDKEFLSNIIDYATIAILDSKKEAKILLENINLRSHLNEMTALNDLVKSVGQGTSFKDTLKMGIELISSWLQVEMAVVLLKNNKNELYVGEALGISEETKKNFKIISDDSTFHFILKNNQPYLIHNYLELEEVYFGFSSIDLTATDFFLCIPIVVSDTQIGLLIVLKVKNKESSAILDEDIRLYSLASSHMAAPLLIAKLMEEETSLMEDPYYSTIKQIRNAIKKRENIGSYSLVALYIGNYDKNVKVNSFEAVNVFVRNMLFPGIKEILDIEDIVLRFQKDKIIIYLPNSDILSCNAFKGKLQSKLTTIAQMMPDMLFSYQVQSVTFPDDGQNFTQLIQELKL